MVIKCKKALIVIIVSLLTTFLIIVSPITVGGRNVTLTYEQEQFLRSSILHVDHMDEIERKNAWIVLNEMREIGFVERSQLIGESGVGTVTWVLDMLELGLISDFAIIEYDNDAEHEELPHLTGHFVARFTTENGNIYYIRYNQSWGLSRIEDERGNPLYCSFRHTLVNGFIEDIRITEPRISWIKVSIIAFTCLTAVGVVVVVFRVKKKRKAKKLVKDTAQLG